MGRTERIIAVHSRVGKSGAVALLFVIAVALMWGLGQAKENDTGTASGRLVIDQHTVTLSYSYAMDQPNTFTRERTDRAVLITEKPLKKGALRGLEDLLDATADKIEGAWIFFKLDDKERPVYEMVSHPALGKNRLSMSGLTRAEFLVEVFTKDHIKGSFRTKKTEDFVGHTYQLDVSLKSPVVKASRPDPLPNARSGSPLPAGGGDPADAYRALHAAIRTKDVVAFRSMAPVEVKVKGLTDKEIQEGLDLMALMTPVEAVFTGGYTNAAGDRAALYFSGVISGEKNYGTVEMVKTGGQWRVKKEQWSSTPPKQ